MSAVATSPRARSEDCRPALSGDMPRSGGTGCRLLRSDRPHAGKIGMARRRARLREPAPTMRHPEHVWRISIGSLATRGALPCVQAIDPDAEWLARRSPSPLARLLSPSPSSERISPSRRQDRRTLAIVGPTVATAPVLSERQAESPPGLLAIADCRRGLIHCRQGRQFTSDPQIQETCRGLGHPDQGDRAQADACDAAGWPGERGATPRTRSPYHPRAHRPCARPGQLPRDRADRRRRRPRRRRRL